MHKKLLLISLAFVFTVQQTAAWFEPKSESELAERLFNSNIGLRPSRVNQEKIIKLVCKVREEALKLKFDEKRVMQLVVDHVQNKIYYYHELMNRPKKDYKFGAQLLAGGVGLGIVGILIGYSTWAAYCDAPQKIKEIKDKLSRLGAFCIFATGDRASALYYEGSQNQSAMRAELRELMHYQANADPGHGFLAAYVCEVASPLVMTVGASLLLDERYSDFYYEKYCFINNELQSHLNLGYITAAI